MKRKKGFIDRTETFDEFLEKDGLLAETQKVALEEIYCESESAGDGTRAR